MKKAIDLLYNGEHPSGVDLQGIDDGEPAVYDVGKVTLQHKGKAGFVFKTDFDISVNADPPPMDTEKADVVPIQGREDESEERQTETGTR